MSLLASSSGKNWPFLIWCLASLTAFLWSSEKRPEADLLRRSLQGGKATSLKKIRQ
jgi:hypothetical protein